MPGVFYAVFQPRAVEHFGNEIADHGRHSVLRQKFDDAAAVLEISALQHLRRMDHIFEHRHREKRTAARARTAIRVRLIRHQFVGQFFDLIRTHVPLQNAQCVRVQKLRQLLLVPDEHDLFLCAGERDEQIRRTTSRRFVHQNIFVNRELIAFAQVVRQRLLMSRRVYRPVFHERLFELLRRSQLVGVIGKYLRFIAP